MANVLSTDRLDRERRFHDAQAVERARTFLREPDRLRFHDDDYLDHEPWVRPAIEALGVLSGRTVLDWGCGHGMAAVVMARRGAAVAACDLSHEYTREAARRASANGVSVRCLQADAHRLPFANESFDVVWGHAILHHLDIGAAARELRRVLRPMGVAVICEPWDGNPLLRWTRRRRLLSRNAHTDDERPLNDADLKTVGSVFPSVRAQGFQLFSMVHSKAPRMPGRQWTRRNDARLLERWPSLQRFGRYVVLTLRRTEPDLSRVLSAVT